MRQIFTTAISSRVIRRLFAAEGYLELGMPKQALAELKGIDEPGPIEASVQFLTGEAFKAQARYDDAIAPLQRAAELIPAPYNKVAWLSLSECFRLSGQDELAEVVEMFASTPDTPDEFGESDEIEDLEGPAYNEFHDDVDVDDPAH